MFLLCVFDTFECRINTQVQNTQKRIEHSIISVRVHVLRALLHVFIVTHNVFRASPNPRLCDVAVRRTTSG